jgi:hypothetical protein
VRGRRPGRKVQELRGVRQGARALRTRGGRVGRGGSSAGEAGRGFPADGARGGRADATRPRREPLRGVGRAGQLEVLQRAEPQGLPQADDSAVSSRVCCGGGAVLEVRATSEDCAGEGEGETGSAGNAGRKGEWAR